MQDLYTEHGLDYEARSRTITSILDSLLQGTDDEKASMEENVEDWRSPRGLINQERGERDPVP